MSVDEDVGGGGRGGVASGVASGDLDEDDQDDEEGQDEDEDEQEGGQVVEGQTLKKKRGRPLGFRPLKKVQRLKKDKKDEEDDPDSDPDDYDVEGEEKINKDGYLLGGREYKFQTFTLPRHPTRLYLYSLDACKILGFRDTYIFFLRNENVKRVGGIEEDREHLNNLGILPAAIKNRPITLVRARALFKIFGHKVVRRGRPVRDDYICTGLEEPLGWVDETGGGDDELGGYGGGSMSKHPANLEGGPFRRHGISIAGFPSPYHPAIPRKEADPGDVFSELEFDSPGPISDQLREDGWMYKCAMSAADFNSKLRRTRPTSFLDLHTNVEQIASGTQPSRVLIEMKSRGGSTLRIENEVACNKTKDDGWKPVSSSHDAVSYPLAVTRNQFQELLAVHPFRFQEGDEGAVYGSALTIKDETDELPPGVEAREVHDLPPTLMGAVPYKPALAITTLTTRKRGRPKKIDGSGDDDVLCALCHEVEPPESADSKIPASISLTCARCASKNHPTCIEFNQNPTLVAKCLSYPWVCSNCKLCVACQDAKDDGKLLFCDLCDRATHTYCLEPPLDELPEGSWLCSQCSNCHSCNANSGTFKHITLPKQQADEGADVFAVFLCTLCKSCNGQFEKGMYCPVCVGTFSKDGAEPLVCCETCDRWIHVDCDPYLSMDKYEELAASTSPHFICVLCSSGRRERFGGNRALVEAGDQILFAPPVKRRKSMISE